MIIVGLILFLITLFVHKHTYKRHYKNEFYCKGEYFTKLKTPLWLVLIIFIISCIPYLNIIGLVVGGYIYLCTISTSNYGNGKSLYLFRAKEDSILDKILKFLNKDI